MRISELAETTAVSVPTLKYYLREGLLMPGVATGRTQATYDDRHVERVRLIRALIDSGGLGIAAVRAVVEALEDPPRAPHDFLAAAHRVVPPPAVITEPTDELRSLMSDLGWEACVDSPLLGALATAVADARAAGLPLPTAGLRDYAEAAAGVARVDVHAATSASTPSAALHLVVVGTVMMDPVIATLRRLAQQVESARVSGLAT